MPATPSMGSYFRNIYILFKLPALLAVGGWSRGHDRFSIDQNLRSLVLLPDISPCHGALLAIGYGGSSVRVFGWRLFLLFLVIAPFVPLHAVDEVVLQDAQNQEEPEEVHSLQTGKQSKGNVLADPALVLLCFPVQLERPNGPEFSQDSPEDLQVDVMSQIDPHGNEKSKVRPDDGRVEIVQGLGCL